MNEMISPDAEPVSIASGHDHVQIVVFKPVATASARPCSVCMP